MTQPITDSTTRFSNRVANYIRFRPRYPAEVITLLREKTGLTTSAIVADIGSGTGIATELFLQNGNPVLGVEPNPEMRTAAEALLRAYPQFRSVPGSAEATTLDRHSVDYVLACQAFHWFDIPKAKKEFRRILKPPCWVVLIWNQRRNTSSFLRAYEKLLVACGTDYAHVNHERVGERELRKFFTEGYRRAVFANEQVFDFAGLKGRLLSSSYTPTERHPGYAPMLAALKEIFEKHQQKGVVRFEYHTRLYYGKL